MQQNGHLKNNGAISVINTSLLKRAVLLFVACFILSACDTVYRSSKVLTKSAGGAEIRVVSLNAVSVTQANASKYTPKTLPAVFSLAAVDGTSLRGVGALPSGPLSAPKPATPLEIRMPPEVKHGPYKIGVGDVVVLSTPESGSNLLEPPGLLAAQNSRQGYTVQDDGSINIPKVGRVEIAELTIKDAESLIFQKLVESQIEPTLSLEIAEFNSHKISVGGAVERSVIVPVTLAPIYLDEALAAAGGIVVSDQSEVSIRLYRDGTLYQIPMTHLYAKTGRIKMRLVDGDAVFVDTQHDLEQAQDYFQQQLLLIEARQRVRQIALEELQAEVALRRANLIDARENYIKRIELGADDRDYVYLTGEVENQSRFALPFGTKAKLADALFDSGGIAVATADVSQIYILRASQPASVPSEVTAWHLDVRNAANFVYVTQFELRPNDIIFVAQQPITRWDRAVSQLVPDFYGASSTVGN